MMHSDQPLPKGNSENWSMAQLEDFGRIRLSQHFFMRDMLYSEVASVHGMRNVPDDPAWAVEVGVALCNTLLEPLHTTFGHVTIRSAFRSAAVNARGENYRNIGGTKWNHARHVWDRPDASNGKKGATACVVIPWFVDYLARRPTMSWTAMGWWIHDHLVFSEVTFFHGSKYKYAAFNIRWHEIDKRCCIKSSVDGNLMAQNGPKHAAAYPGFPKFEHMDES